MELPLFSRAMRAVLKDTLIDIFNILGILGNYEQF